ncbi:MAG: 3-oxoacyl-(Acyl-carrier-protein) reductase [Candidatus Jorgensenbacteria bacterium GW2011_GWA1_48_11]|uniref:3-oxoacyl-(Acyl-carrier-protein) reductase n=1 Tax=Candidatus Jorgensenbacteria bacterium GW2011_GWA1_48_11 TaxID=1618660 RepID=A0A0G1UBI5_9BACT|nr:MAG: 3-oxoacyl-(Acyl-carrier-protein) reductase [Candidatus Jorgensenbacteria bacterium GW2011_GWA1_48_11]KKW11972.1 MAG: 3-oxoacyl-(Acyl-carrier-protein) reductase [Candidatus Jorgensenbacteria bacterium GW2011_GWB1_49_9]
MTEPRDLSINDISVGDTASFDRIWTNEDVLAFASLTGDKNPLHLDEEYARKTKFGRRLVHGMLVGSACSTLVGMYLPGKRCLYVRQTLDFKEPVFIGDKVVIRGEVKSKSLAIGLVDIFISIIKDGRNAVEGTATVQILS